jgi:hypothetical protein
MKRTVVLAVAGVLGARLLTVAQEPAAPVVFEVAAVKRNTSGQIAAQWDDSPAGDSSPQMRRSEC